MIKTSPERRLEIIQTESYLDCTMICELYGIGKNKAYKIIKDILQESNSSNLLSQKPILVPTEAVLEKYTINIKSLERYVERQNKKC